MPVPFWLGHVEDLVDQPFARLLVHFAKDVAGDLHKIAVQFTVVPLTYTSRVGRRSIPEPRFIRS